MGMGYLSVPGMPLIGGVIILIGMLALHLPLFLTQNFSSFVDRDMLMRFHWGLSVGHVYTHQQLCTNAAVAWSESESRSNQSSQSRNVPEGPESLDQMGMENDIGSGTGTDGSGSESEDSDYKPSEGEEAESSDDEDDSDDEHLLDNEEMYGSFNSDNDLFEDI
jgi:hypothetical protein